VSSVDYRCCDVCGCKVFYDAYLNYDEVDGVDPEWVVKMAGEISDVCEYRLESLGDWAVLCHECAKTHRTMIISRSKIKRSKKLLDAFQHMEEIWEAYVNMSRENSKAED